MLLVFPALARSVAVISPNLYFAADPRVLPFPFDGLGPASLVSLDLLSILGLTLVLVAESWYRRRLDWRLLTLAAVPAPTLIWHAMSSTDDAWIGSGWLAAMATAVGAAHLGRDHRYRIAILAVVCAMVAPLVVKGAYQFAVEHPMTVENFRANEAEILAAHGWEPDSSQARLYIRRLEQNEATGWFALSNVYGSVLATLAIFWIAATVTSARSRLSSGWIGLILLVAAGAMSGVALSRSKGAIAGVVIGMGLAACTIAPKGWRNRIRPWTARITLALLIAVLVGVVARGAALGEAFTADGYSLLFRWHYWQGAARILADHLWLGAGPDGFKDAYMIAKPPESPEEVATPHSVFITWLATMGLSAIAWIALVVVLIRNLAPSGAQQVSESTGPTADGPRTPTPMSFWWRSAGAIGIVVVAFGWWVNRASMPIDFRILFWPLSVAAFVGLAVMTPWLGRFTSWSLLRWGVWAAVTVALVHAQIETTFTQPGSAALLLLCIGAAGATPRVIAERSRRSSPILTLVACALTVGAWAILIWSPVIQEQTRLRNAAKALHEVGEIRLSLADSSRTGREWSELIALWRQTSDQLSAAGFDPKIGAALSELQSARAANDSARIERLVDRIAFSIELAMSRFDEDRTRRAQALLVETANSRTAAREGAGLSLDLAVRAAARDADDESAAYLSTARASVNSLLTREKTRASDFALAGQIEIRAYELFGDARSLNAAVAHFEEAARLDPYGVSSALRLAEALRRADRRSDARKWFERTLELDENLRLDPAKRLSDRERRRIERLLAEESG